VALATVESPEVLEYSVHAVAALPLRRTPWTRDSNPLLASWRAHAQQAEGIAKGRGILLDIAIVVDVGLGHK